MRRAARLFEIVQLVRGRRLSTAAFLAARLEVSLRTVYRDVADLVAQGIPIEGEAGVGYRMRPGFDLAALMFSVDEARALVAVIGMAAQHLDDGLAKPAETALSKILAVLPVATRAAADRLAVLAPPIEIDAATRARLGTLRAAVDARQRARFSYRDRAGAASARTVRPLACVYWGTVWTLAAWCESKRGFRNFRIDRIDALEILPGHFRDEAGKTLADLLRAVEAEGRRPT